MLIFIQFKSINYHLLLMKDNSCRKCGEELQVNKECDICNQANQFSCQKCGYVTDEQIHNQCIMISLGHKLLNLK